MRGWYQEKREGGRERIDATKAQIMATGDVPKVRIDIYYHKISSCSWVIGTFGAFGAAFIAIGAVILAVCSHSVSCGLEPLVFRRSC